MPTNEEWDVNVLLENLKQEVDSREICFRMSSGASSGNNMYNNSYESKNYRSEEEEYTGSTLYTGGQNVKVSCTYCRREHTSEKCNVITDVQARKAILRNKAKCFGCLKSGHVIRNCLSRMKCWRCKGRHHISICDADNRQNPHNGQASMQSRTDMLNG